MPWYLIQYLDQYGRKRRIEVEGVDDADAIQNSRIDENQILKATQSMVISGQEICPYLFKNSFYRKFVPWFILAKPSIARLNTCSVALAR